LKINGDAIAAQLW